MIAHECICMYMYAYECKCMYMNADVCICVYMCVNVQSNSNQNESNAMQFM